VKPADNPLNHGFDEFFGVMDTSQPYFGEKEGNPILRGRTPVPATGYLTETFATEAASFIRRHAAQKFLLYAPFTASATSRTINAACSPQFWPASTMPSARSWTPCAIRAWPATPSWSFSVTMAA
jgi:hypothetical protein